MFFITGRGPVIVMSLWKGGELKAGDWVELRSADGTSNFVKIKSFDMVRGSPNAKRIASTGGRYAFTLAEIRPNAVKQGDEVWSVYNLPAEYAREP